MSYEEFLTWTNEDTHAEWSNGEVIVQMPATLVHQLMVGFLLRLLSPYTRLFELGKVIMAPFEVKLTPTGSSREPDLLFLAKENLSRLTEDRLEGAPDLVIEVISKSSVKIDRDDKLKEYQAAGVREYWIIDPRVGKQRMDCYRLDDQGIYYLYAMEDTEVVASQFIQGFWLRPEWLWQAENLNPLTCLLQMEGMMEKVTEQMNLVRGLK
jgi:Uma2 family endonuclease